MSVALASNHQAELDKFMAGLEKRNPGEPEFHQAVQEVAETLIPYIDANPVYRRRPDPRTYDRTRPGRDLPGDLGGRRWQRACQPGLARAVQQLDRPLQGRSPVPPRSSRCRS